VSASLLQAPIWRLAEGFAHHVVALARENGAPDRTLAPAGAARATACHGAGHVCTALPTSPRQPGAGPATLREALLG